jgi:hypothetical protein
MLTGVTRPRGCAGMEPEGQHSIKNIDEGRYHAIRIRIEPE